MITTHKAHTPVYQSVIEKTRGLSFRTQALGAAMNRRAAGENPAPTGKENEKSRDNKGRGRRTDGGEKNVAIEVK